MTVSYSVKGDAFVAEKPRVWIAALGGPGWDIAPDGKRVAVLIPEVAAQAQQQEHEIVISRISLTNCGGVCRSANSPGLANHQDNAKISSESAER